MRIETDAIFVVCQLGIIWKPVRILNMPWSLILLRVSTLFKCVYFPRMVQTVKFQLDQSGLSVFLL